MIGIDSLVKSKNIAKNILIEKSQIPQPLQSDFLRDFTNLVKKLSGVQSLLEHCHRNTASESRHEALGEAYRHLSYKKDEIIEFIIGSTGLKYGDLEQITLPPFEPNMSDLAADLTEQLGIEIQEFAQKYNIPCVDNSGQDVNGIGCKLNYMLGMTNPGEN